MAIFVLVPGAWLGGWAWADVARALRGRGHDVYPVTLPGLGERVHLAGPQIDLETHVTDIVNVIEFEDLHDVMLIGHSYGGTPVTGAADRIPDRLARVIYVDSGPAQDGAAFLDILPPPVREATERHVEEEGEGRRLPMPTWEELETLNRVSLAGLDEERRNTIRGRAVAQPFGTYAQPTSLTNPARTRLPHALITCSFPLDQVRAMIASGHPWFRELAGSQWSFVELMTSHWPMFSAPDRLVDALDRVGV